MNGSPCSNEEILIVFDDPHGLPHIRCSHRTRIDDKRWLASVADPDSCHGPRMAHVDMGRIVVTYENNESKARLTMDRGH